MASVNTVLLAISDNQEWSDVKSVLVNEYGYRVLIANTAKKALSLTEEANIDLVICEAYLEDKSALIVLQQCRVTCPNAMRILVKEANGDDKKNHVAAERAAIYQFIRKPIDAEQVGMVVKRALETAELSRRHRLISRELKLNDDSPIFTGKQNGSAVADCSRFEKLVYVSESMAELCNIAKQAAGTNLPILIQGETGTGKELMARAIHFNSNRTDSPLIVQNCGGISDEMLHSELFGHMRGAFPGAISDRLGLFRAADGGTVFLDEISEISPAFQVSLLRLVQEGEVKPLGSDINYHCDVRIICASNRRLSEMVAKGEFRQDLYFRLKGFELVVPPLRDRRDDIAVLAEFFTRKYTELTNVKLLGISNAVLDRLQHHPYPGNVRELENEVQRMVALAKDGEYLTIRHMSEEFSSIIPDQSSTDAFPNLSIDGATLKEKVESLEKHLVKEALNRLRWNQSKVALELGLSRVGLANKIKRYHLANTS
ncbi:MAG: sigma-54-dependent Fis family transcriptional regulator [Robiginitomaculum sp.]|nr:MAG: sigma-54-dependent Fis family transcriptional regulator [Robiginitomaculum sp.]